jgi:hypothetical protein
MVAMRRVGRSVQDAPALLKVGDERYSAYNRYANEITGNIFVFRRGRVVHSLIVTGIYFEDPDGVRRLFTPMLEAAKKFESS